MNDRLRRKPLENSADGKDYYRDAYYSMELKGDERILSIGVGDGRDEARWAIEFGHRGDIVGIDVPTLEIPFHDRFHVAQSELYAAMANNVHFEEGNAQYLQYDDNSFDVVAWPHVGYHIYDVKLGLEEVRRVLKPSGKFFNMTNGSMNKPLQHSLIADTKQLLGVEDHSPFSANYNLETARRLNRRLIGPRYRKYLQQSVYLVGVDDLPGFENSIDSYASTAEGISHSDWQAARREVLGRWVVPVVERGGKVVDWIHRGDGTYINSKLGRHLPRPLGQKVIKLARIK